MEQIQAWFSPLLWILGTIGTLAAFVRLCKPIWAFFTAPAETEKKFEELDKKLDVKFDNIEKQITNLKDQVNVEHEKIERVNLQNEKEDAVTLSLLHDQILQIYENAKDAGTISEMQYYRACELYKQNGNSQYIDDIMTALREMHTACALPQEAADEKAKDK